VRGSSSAIPNWSRIGWDEPPLRRRARTVKSSPSENGLAGTKLAPSPWGQESSRPACTPLREPVTLITLMSAAGTPRKLIWVAGEASRLPDTGDTVTDPAFIAELFNVAGVHVGPTSAAGAAAAAGPKAKATPRPRIRARTATTSESSSKSAPTPRAAPPPVPAAPALSSDKPNILVIVVDQLRFPQWFSPTPLGLALPPNIARLRRGAVSFARHYTASNDCTPARATLLTGLYTHQTGCMITG